MAHLGLFAFLLNLHLTMLFRFLFEPTYLASVTWTSKCLALQMVNI